MIKYKNQWLQTYRSLGSQIWVLSPGCMPRSLITSRWWSFSVTLGKPKLRRPIHCYKIQFQAKEMTIIDRHKLQVLVFYGLSFTSFWVTNSDQTCLPKNSNIAWWSVNFRLIFFKRRLGIRTKFDLFELEHNSGLICLAWNLGLKFLLGWV